MDAVPGGPKTHGSGSATLVKITLKQCCGSGSGSKLQIKRVPIHNNALQKEERCSYFLKFYFNLKRFNPEKSKVFFMLHIGAWHILKLFPAFCKFVQMNKKCTG
jgi:hypothetical protein